MWSDKLRVIYSKPNDSAEYISEYPSGVDGYVQTFALER